MYESTYIYCLALSMGRISSKDTPVAVSIPGTEILISKYHYPIKEPGHLEEIVDSKEGAKERKDEPRISCRTRR